MEMILCRSLHTPGHLPIGALSRMSRSAMVRLVIYWLPAGPLADVANARMASLPVCTTSKAGYAHYTSGWIVRQALLLCCFLLYFNSLLPISLRLTLVTFVHIGQAYVAVCLHMVRFKQYNTLHDRDTAIKLPA